METTVYGTDCSPPIQYHWRIQTIRKILNKPYFEIIRGVLWGRKHIYIQYIEDSQNFRVYFNSENWRIGDIGGYLYYEIMGNREGMVG